MGKGGIGVGSASIVLVFAVLCLTVFSLITLVISGNDKALVDARVQLVTGYYEADALAERILADILAADSIPATLHGVEIQTKRDDELNVEVNFYCRISDMKSLYVNLVLRGDSFDILSWRMMDSDNWVFDNVINVWTGEAE
jgi:hypothetical protein